LRTCGHVFCETCCDSIYKYKLNSESICPICGAVLPDILPAVSFDLLSSSPEDAFSEEKLQHIIEVGWYLSEIIRN
jgi:hypothetical protein